MHMAQRLRQGVDSVHNSSQWDPPWCLSAKERILWYISVIPAPTRLRQVYYCEFEASLGHIARLCPQTKQTRKERRKEEKKKGK